MTEDRSDEQAVALCADTAAAWHASWLTALGLRSERRDGLWTALDPPPFIYWTAITLRPDVPAERLRGLRGTICDSWSAVDLSDNEFVLRDRDGFEETATEPWFLRPPGMLPVGPMPAELTVVTVAGPEEVLEFEAVSVRGFGGDDASEPAGSLHPRAILDDPRMTMLIGRVDGRAVAAAMSYRTDRAVGIYGVTTVTAARGRGYASTLTARLIDPGLPAVLSPSPEGERLYRRLGFDGVGRLRQWRRL